MQREARWGATIPGTGASGATGDVGEMRGIIAVPPWSRQAGGEADGGEEGAARGGAQRGESKGEAEMALGAAGRTPARAATPRGNTLRLGEPKGGGQQAAGGKGPGLTSHAAPNTMSATGMGAWVAVIACQHAR